MRTYYWRFSIFMVLAIVSSTACASQSIATSFSSHDTSQVGELKTEIRVWAYGELFDLWRVSGPVEAVKRNPSLKVEATGVLYDIEQDRLETIFKLAIEKSLKKALGL